MTFSFRVPFRLPSDQRIIWPNKRVDLYSSDGEIVYVQADAAEDISSSDRLSLRGLGYTSEEDARCAGERWTGWLAVGLIDLLIGMNMGQFTDSGGGASGPFLAQLSAADPTHQLFREHVGLFVFPTDPPAVFIGMEAAVVGGKRAEGLIERTLQARNAGSRLDSALLRASNVYALAMALPTDESRFITIMAAIEGLLKRDPRPADALALISSFVKQLNASELEQDEKSSINGALRELKLISIGKSGELLSRCLEGKQYLGLPAPKFLTHAYKLRSRMSHGEVSQALVAQIRIALPGLQWFFRDLILRLAQTNQNSKSN